MFSRFRSSHHATSSNSNSSNSRQNTSISPTIDEHSDPSDSSADEFDDLDLSGLVLRPQPAQFTTSSHRRNLSDDDPTGIPPVTSSRRRPRSFLRGSSRSHSRSQSKRKTVLSPSPSRTSTHESETTMATLTGGKDSPRERSHKLDSWFSGMSDPLAIGLTVKEQIHAEKEDESKQNGKPNKLQRRSGPPSSSSLGKTSQASTSRLSFFSTGSKEKAIGALPLSADEVLQLDVAVALKVDPSTDLTSPASFNTLYAKAETLLSRMQTTYRVRTIALQELQQEKEAQEEEFEGAETRVRHLKMQLADMAEKVAEREKAMVEMAESLASERQLRREEHAARKKSITLVKAPPDLASSDDEDDNHRFVPRNTARDSGIALSSDSNISDFEEDNSSSADSVFSRSAPQSRDGAVSPSGTMLSSVSETSASSPTSLHRSDISITSSAAHACCAQAVVQTIQPFHISAARPPPLKRQTSTFQKVLLESDADCCPPAVDSTTVKAWNLLGQLKMENNDLKRRNGELERAVEDTLSLVNGL